MQIIFMNRLSRLAGREEEEFAQLWIGEEEGVWSLGWRDFSVNTAEESTDSLWYEGGSWNEMLCVYRHELAVKMGAGYRPLIDGGLHEEEVLPRRGREQLKLQYYSEHYSQESIYDELCAWRRGRASSERKAPYMLASNRLLRLLSTFLPKTTEELLQIPGIGEAKAAQYGADWLAVTSAAPRERNFPLDWVYEEIGDDEFSSWLYKQKELKYKRQLERLRLNRTLLQGIESSLGLEQLKNETGVSRRELLEALEELEKDGYSVEKLIQHELGSMAHEEQQAVWKAYEEFGDLFLKPVLYKVYGDAPPAAAGGLEIHYERLRLIRIRFRREQAGSLDSAMSF
ncbi:HRDC domain-containing protein [Paenibacillus sp. NPDC058177]|uniref:HRDC domain-containing protein n=1 Tax=Paenibacillus sp. NPDC058177 TaxID=3346369 RepID=UPI0036DAF749